jgi:hypothetical protein
LAESKAATQTKKPLAIPPMMLVIVLVAVVGLAGFWYLDRASRQPPPGPPPLTGPAREYVKFLKFVAADGQTAEAPVMEAHESYLKQSVVEITGSLLNAGDRVLNSVEINCVFYDPYGQVILRERVPVITRKMGGVAPREAKPFRLAFDSVPDSWNQMMPQMVIAGIDFR